MKMMKTEMEFVTFDAQDVIATSGPFTGVLMKGTTINYWKNDGQSESSYTIGDKTYVSVVSSMMGMYNDLANGGPFFSYYYAMPKEESFDDNLFYIVSPSSAIKDNGGKYNVYFQFNGTREGPASETKDIITWILENGQVIQ